MTLGEARDRIAQAVKDAQAEGYEVMGYDDTCIYIRGAEGETYVDPSDPDRRPDATPRGAI